MSRLFLHNRLRRAVNQRCMQPREFCKRWLEATDEDEQQRGYRARCVRLLSEVTGVASETINSTWGAGVDFPKMPEQHAKTLAYADLVRAMLAAGVRSHPDILNQVLSYLKD